jgi:hypothetical protein
MSDDPFRQALGQAGPGPADTRQREERQQARMDRLAATQATLGNPAARRFLAERLRLEMDAAPWRPGDTLEMVANRAGRVDLLRDLIAEIETPPTPGA